MAGWPSNCFKMAASYLKRVCFNLEDALDFFIVQTGVRALKNVALKTNR